MSDNTRFSRKWRAMRDESSAQKSVEDIVGEAAGTGRHLTRRHLIPLGLAVIIGSGAYNLLGATAASNGIFTTTAGLILAALACFGAALCFAEMASTVPVSGSAYTYAYAAFGKTRAWLVGWLLLLQYSAGASVIAIDWARYVLPPDLRSSPGQTLANTAIAGGVLLAAITVALLIIDRSQRTPKFAITVIGVSVFVKLAALALTILVGIYLALTRLPESPTPVALPAESLAILPSFAILYFAFLGFDAIGTAAEESRYPPRDLPRSILTALGIAAIVYFALLATTLLLAVATGASPGLLALMADEAPWMAGVIYVGAALGLPSGVAILLYGQSRILRAIHRDRLFAVRPPSHHRPRRSLRIEALLAGAFASLWILLILVYSLDSATLARVVNLASAAAFAIVAVSTWILRYRRPDLPSTFRVPFLPAVTVITVLISIALFLSAPEEIPYVVIWLLAGAVVQLPFFLRRATRLERGV